MAKRPEGDRLYASPATIYHLLDCGRDTLQEWEKSDKIVQDIHFIRLGTQRRYSVELILVSGDRSAKK